MGKLNIYIMKQLMNTQPTNLEICESDCPICRAKGFGNEWTKKVLTTQNTVEEAATFWNMSVDEVHHHMAEHDIVKYDEDGDGFSSPDDLLNQLLNSLNILKSWIDVISTDSKEPPANTVKSLVQLTKEIRETIKLVYEVQGKLDTQISKDKITAMETSVQQVINLVLTTTCRECRTKITDSLSH